MNKRRRFKAKALRRWHGGARARRFVTPYQICPKCKDYIMACVCLETEMTQMFGLPPHVAKTVVDVYLGRKPISAVSFPVTDRRDEQQLLFHAENLVEGRQPS